MDKYKTPKNCFSLLNIIGFKHQNDNTVLCLYYYIVHSEEMYDDYSAKSGKGNNLAGIVTI